MEVKNLKSSFIKYVSLNVLGMIGLSCYILADTFFVATGIGADGLAALNLAIPIYSFINGFGLMVGMGGATRFCISKSNNVFTQSLYYLLIFSLLFLVIGVFWSSPLAEILGTDSVTHIMTNTYLKVILLFAPMFMLNNLVICFVRNDGNPRLSMTAMLLGSLSNIILDYIFIFPLNMGMFGAALATGIAPVVSLMILSIHFVTGSNNFKVVKEKPKVKDWYDISLLGSSSLITEFSSGIVIIIFNEIILGLEGNLGVAAYGIIANIALVIISIYTGISQGIQPIVSKCYGDGEIRDTKKLLKYGIIIIISISIIIYVGSFVFAESIVNLFNKDHNMILANIATRGMRMYFTAFIFVGMNIIISTYFSSVDMPRISFVISMLRGFIIIIPTAYILSSLLKIDGVWITMTVTEIIVLCYSLNRLISKKHQ